MSFLSRFFKVTSGSRKKDGNKKVIQELKSVINEDNGPWRKGVRVGELGGNEERIVTDT